MRRRVPWWVLALLFVVLPIVEIYFLVQLGQEVGALWTILILIAIGALGAYLVKHEGSRAWRALQAALASRRMPSAELADGALILIGGTLLLTPGFVSDAFGLFCVLPVTRPLARRWLTTVIARRLSVGVATRPAATAPNSTGTARRPGHGDVVRGEVVDES